MKKIFLLSSLTLASFQLSAHRFEGQLPTEKLCREAIELVLRLTVELDKTVTGAGRTDILRKIHNLSSFMRLCSDEVFIEQVPSLKID